MFFLAVIQRMRTVSVSGIYQGIVESKMADKGDKGAEKSFLARTASITTKRAKRAQEKVM